MTRLSNSFEGGTDGVAITEGNSGGASGDASDNILVGGVGTLTYNAANAYSSGMCAEFDPDISHNCYFAYNQTLGTDVYCRFYIKLPTLPAGSFTVVAFRDSVTSTNFGRLVIQTDGRILLIDSAGTTVATTPNDVTGKLVAGSYARVEAKFIGNAATGILELKLFLTPSSSTASSTTTAPAIDTSGAIDRIRFGQTSSLATDLAAFYIDEIVVDTAGYVGAGWRISPGLITATPTLFAPASLKQTMTAGLLSAIPSLFTPKVNPKVSPGLLDATPSLFTPSKLNQKVTSGGVFQASAFQDSAFQIGTTLFVDASPVLYEPVLPLLGATINAPGPTSWEEAFQANAFQDNAFQLAQGSGLNASPTIYAPTSVANNPTLAQFIYLTGGEGWDSTEILWDTPDHNWDEAVGGVIQLPPHLFTPSVKASITVGLIDASPVLYIPNANPSSVLMGIITLTPALFNPALPETIVMGLLDLSALLFEFTFPINPSPDLLDASPQLYTPNVNPPALDIPLINVSGFLFTPSVNMQVVPGLIDISATVLTPSAVGNVLYPDLIDVSAIVYTPSLERLFFDLIDVSPTVYEPAKVNLPVNSTVRLDDDPSGLVEASPVVYEPVSVSLATAQVINVTYIDDSATVFATRVFPGSFVIPRTRKIATYEPVLRLHADYQPILRKEASFLGVKSPITKADAWFIGEDQTFEFLSLTAGLPDNVTGWTIQFRMATDDGEPSLLTIAAVLTDATHGVFQIVSPSASTLSLEPDVYYYDVSRLDAGNNQVLAFGPAHLQARVT